METSLEKAFTFLCKRNLLDIDQSEYVSMLMEFQDEKGDYAIEALAGFYIWTINNVSGEKQDQALLETFTHDLIGRNDKFCLPRSNAYKEFWDKELINRQ